MPFWEEKTLTELSPVEWESLCDNCGRCCVEKFIDDDTEELVYSNSACQLYDCKNHRCRDYAQRHKTVPECIPITPAMLADDDTRRWLPFSCAYRRLAEGRGLADWHPLISGYHQTVIDAGIAIRQDELTHPEKTAK